MLTFDSVRNGGYLLFEYIRGSHAYGLNRAGSDIDKGGVYMEPYDILMSLGNDYQEEIKDKKQDTCWFSFKKFMDLLLKSNPTVLESLFIPERCILFEHPIFAELRKNRDMFITKACFKPFMGYSMDQIKKARSLNKKIVQPLDGPKQSILDFIFYRYKQGSRQAKLWIEENGLNQRYCGLVNVDRMIGIFAMYYDWGGHLYNELGIKTFDEFKTYCESHLNTDYGNNDKDLFDEPFLTLFFRHNLYQFNIISYDVDGSSFIDWKEGKKIWDKYGAPLGYKGIVNKADTSNEVRLSSVLKYERSILDVSYYKDGYQTYCRQYADWQEWNKMKNKERFQEVLDHKNFDAKNMCHSMRLLTMGIEVAQGKGFRVDRTGIDADYLMKIRTGQTTYEEILKILEEKDKEMKAAMETSTLPEKIDVEKVNELMINLRTKFYEHKKLS